MSLNSFSLPDQLAALAQQQLQRKTQVTDAGVTPTIVRQGRTLINFSSNDYLGLASHPQVRSAAQQYLKAHGLGAGAAHLITGHTTLHEQLEERLAAVSGYPKALLFSTGYMANLGVIDALMSPSHLAPRSAGDVVYHDRLNHASLLDGSRLAGARLRRYPHQQTDVLAGWLAQAADINKRELLNKQPRQLIVSDQVFSMDGTEAPLAALRQLAQDYHVALMIDDAHGFGLRAQPLPSVDVYMATLGKAVGTFGAFVAGSAELIDFLRSKARTYCYTTATPPVLAAATLAALDVIRDTPRLVTTLTAHIERFRTAVAAQGWQLTASQTAIQPIIVGGVEQTLALAQMLEAQGLLAVAIRPPTVPDGTSRLRITLSAAHSEAHVERLIDALAGLTRFQPRMPLA